MSNTKMKLLAFIIIIECALAKELNLDLVSDYTVDDCLKINNEDHINYYSVDADGFPYCAKYTKDASCDDDNACAPGLICGEDGECVVDTSSCFKYYITMGESQNVSLLLWAPDCTADGFWAPKQCKGGPGGRCFCYDKKGTRLFGNAFLDQSNDMTCACTRKKAELLDSSNPNPRTFVSFHCDQKGNFEELQCDSGHCWCADPKTGEPTSVIVPEKNMKFLKCFKKLKGSQYLRKCESIAHAQAKIIETLTRRGVVSPNIKTLHCQDDGSYGPTTTENAVIYCVSQTNAKSAYHVDITSDNTIPNCNCALDQELYKKLGKTLNLQCKSSGDYQTFQMDDGAENGFCVDTDGNKLIDDIDETVCDDYSDYLGIQQDW